MEAAEELRDLARDGLRKIAVRELKARGPRMDAVFYLLDAMRLFSGKSLEEVREISFEIACWASTGWISTTPGDACPAGAAGDGFLSSEAGVHHVRELKSLEKQFPSQSYANFFRLALWNDM